MKRHKDLVHSNGDRTASAVIGPTRRQPSTRGRSTSQRFPWGDASFSHNPSGTRPSPRTMGAILDLDNSPASARLPLPTPADDALGALTISSPPALVPNALPQIDSHPTPAGDEPDWEITTPQFLETAGLVVIVELKAVLCIECQHCLPLSHVIGHLKDAHKSTGLTTKVFMDFAHLEGLAMEAKNVIAKVKDTRRFTASRWLRQEKGWWCEECGYATKSEAQAKHHKQNAEHPFSEKVVKVNNNRYRRSNTVIEGQLQTLFVQNQGGLIPSLPRTDSDATTETSASKLFRKIIDVENDTFEPPIINQDDPRTVHPFIHTSGFQRWLGDRTWKEVEGLQALWNLEQFSWGAQLREDCQEMMSMMFALCLPENYSARCQVNSPR